VLRRAADSERRTVWSTSVGTSARTAIDAGATFHWPPTPGDSSLEVVRLPDDAAPPSASPHVDGAITLTDAPPIRDSNQTPSVPVPDPEETSYQALQSAIRSPAPREGPAPSKGESPTRKGRPAAPRQPRGSARSHVVAITLILLAIVAAAEGIYILRPGWFRRTTAPTVDAETPPSRVAQISPPATGPGALPPRVSSAAAAAKDAVRTGRLSIRTEPAGAAVSIDGRYYGVSPLFLAAVVPGERRIVLKVGGHEVRQTVRVEAGGTASVIVPMLRVSTTDSGWIAITSAVDLDVFENGVMVGSTRSPQIMMPAGQHKLRLVNEMLGYEGMQEVRVEPGKVARVGHALPESTISLNALPWAEAWIDGKSVGETPIGNLPIKLGRHEILFRHPELGEKSLSTMVKAGGATRVTTDMRK
jgi:PEGA domain